LWLVKLTLAIVSSTIKYLSDNKIIKGAKAEVYLEIMEDAREKIRNANAARDNADGVRDDDIRD